MVAAAGTGLRALLLENIHDDAAFALRDAGFVVERVDRALSEPELLEHVQGVAVLGIRSNTQLTASVLQAARELLGVGAFCIGTNQIDLAAAADRGIAVFNAPFSNTRSVVELALSEIIALTRRLTDNNADMHAGRWDKSAVGSHEVRGRRLGIVGYGNIGSQLSVLAEALGMRVLFYDTSDKLSLGNARRWAPWTSCSPSPTSSRCTLTAGRATATSSANSSWPGCARGASCSTSRAAS